MKIKTEQNFYRKGLTYFFVIAASMILYYLMFHTKQIKTGISSIVTVLNPIIYGFVIAYVLNPVMQLIENLIYTILKKTGKKKTPRVSPIVRIAASFLTIFLALLMIYGLLAMILPELISSIRGIIVKFPVYVDNVNKFVDTQLFATNEELDTKTTAMITEYAAKIQEWFSSEIVPLLNSLATDFTGYILNFLTFVKNFFLGVIISLYVMISRDNLVARFRRTVYSFFSIPTANRMLLNLRFVDEKFGGFLIGKIIDSMIIGVICYLGNLLLGMPYAILIAVFIGISNVIPFFGPLIGAIPSTVLIFFEDPVKALVFLIFILCLQQFDGNFLGPKILGSSVGVSSFMVILAILIGGGFFGVTGMIIGVPFCAIFVAVIQTRILRNMKKKQLPGDLESYHTLNVINPITGEFVQEEKPDGEQSLYDKIRWRSNTARSYDRPLKAHTWELTMAELAKRDEAVYGVAADDEHAEEDCFVNEESGKENAGQQKAGTTQNKQKGEK
ncbi:MAG: AI-2E family transporter [Lachnospiraceae bacterium]|nr:AI-2E family transporter [Lachnospiraceae bacterium]